MSSGKTKVDKIPTQTKEQQAIANLLGQLSVPGLQGGNLIPGASDLQNQIFGQAGSALPDIFSGFNPERSAELFESAVGNQARTRFSEETLPQLLQQFASSGASINSPASQQAAAKAAAGLEGQLASAQGQFFQGQQQNSMTQLQQLLGIGGEQREISRQQQGLPLQLAQLALGNKAFEPIARTQPSFLQQAGQVAGAALPFLLL